MIRECKHGEVTKTGYVRCSQPGVVSYAMVIHDHLSIVKPRIVEVVHFCEQHKDIQPFYDETFVRLTDEEAAVAMVLES